MEIKNVGKAYSAYNTAKLSKSTGGAAPAASANAKKTDKIDFNHAAQLETAKADIVASVRADATPERIAQLREKIEQGNYFVASEHLSRIISGLAPEL